MLKFISTSVVVVAAASALAVAAYAKPSGKAPAKSGEESVPVYSQPFTASCAEAVNRDALIAHLQRKGMSPNDAAQKARELLEKYGSYGAVQQRNCD